MPVRNAPKKPSRAAKKITKPVAKAAAVKNGSAKNGSAKHSVSATPDKAGMLALYEKMMLLRQFELRAQAMGKKGEMPNFLHLYVGEEAVATGVTAHLKKTDWITSTHRGHGHCLAKGMPPRDLMAELYAKATGCCGGRGGSMHLYDPDNGVFGTNGIVGAGLPHAVGAGISARLRGTDGVAVAFFGDGAVNHGAFHEALNFAGAQNAPVVFVCENNLYATATPLKVATKNTEVATKAISYGFPGIAVDGNDVIGVWKVAKEAIERARRGEGPTLIEAKTYRTVGHNEGEPLTGTYRTQEELDLWKTRDPIPRFSKYLLSEKIVKQADLDAADARVEKIVDEAVEYARNSPLPDPASFSLHSWSEKINPEMTPIDPSLGTVEQGWLEAVKNGLSEEMRRNPHTIYFGEGTGERGGSFAHTKGMWAEFGGHRMVDTPICELGFTGASIGASATGVKAVADLMFVDFLFETGGQIPLQASKLRYMSNGRMSSRFVVRAPCGAVRSAGPHHSGMYHSIWSHYPGIIVVMPSNPADAKGLMKTAMRANDPVIFLEPKALFASKGQVPNGEYTIPFGVARVARPGTSLTIVAAGRMVGLALEAAEALAKDGTQAEVIDVRTIVPLDLKTITASVAKTNHLLVVDEGYAFCGFGAEVIASINELAFDDLDAPITRLQMEPVAHPFNAAVEAETMPTTNKIVAAAKNLLAGGVTRGRRMEIEGGAPTAAPNIESPSEIEIAKQDVPKMTTPAIDLGKPATSDAPAAPKVEIMEGETIYMPHGDLTISEGKVVNWLKKVGDKVAKDEGVCEIETDKAVMAIESPAAGTLIQIVAPEGTVVKMGETVGVLGK
jgi:2-oxoisovalerate dehydrogenase E1 component